MSILRNKYHRVWCALVVGAQWVGHSCVTSVHFSSCVLWIMVATRYDNLCSLGATLIFGYDTYLHSSKQE